MFEAVEQARVEALGSNAMPGMANNLTAVLEDRFAKSVVNRSSNRRDTPLEEAVALMVRERLTGAPPPANAKMYVDLWRSWVEDKAAARLDTLGNAIHDQAAFARLTRDLIAETSTWPMNLVKTPTSLTKTMRMTKPSPMAASARRAPTAKTRRASRKPLRSCRKAKARPKPPSRRASRVRSTTRLTIWKARKSTRVTSPWRPQLPFSSLSNENFYKVFDHANDEEISAEDLCDSEELTRLRNYLDKQLSHLQGVVARLANRLQRRLMAQQNRSWDFDLEEGVLDTARLMRIVIGSNASALLQDGAGHEFP